MDIFDINLIKTGVVVESKEALLAMMVNDLYENKVLQFKEAFLTAIKERESILSTGIGHNIAIPHARHQHVNDLKAVVYVLANDLDYDALDGNPVRIIVMLAVPSHCSTDYMKALHTITTKLRDEMDREFFRECGEPAVLYEYLMKTLTSD